MDLPDFTSSGMGLLSAPATDAAVFPAPFSTSPRIPVTKAEDPAMFLSSPARRFGGPGMTPDRRPAARQPYHHQVEESKREELRRVLSSGGHRPGSWSSFSDEVTYKSWGIGLMLAEVEGQAHWSRLGTIIWDVAAAQFVPDWYQSRIEKSVVLVDTEQIPNAVEYIHGRGVGWEWKSGLFG